jgi:hypothetical protein
MRLPEAEVAQIIGLIEQVEAGSEQGRGDLPELAAGMQLDADDLFPLIDAAELLGFAQTREGDINLLPEGVKLARSDIQERKVIFAEHLMNRVPLVAHIRRVLSTRPDHRARRVSDFSRSWKILWAPKRLPVRSIQRLNGGAMPNCSSMTRVRGVCACQRTADDAVRFYGDEVYRVYTDTHR